MIKEETIRRLTQISTVHSFNPQEYIYYEGEPGDKMYIVIKGVVGMYVNNAIDEQIEVARAEVGGIFGELAVFDNLPRSTSTIALEDVICVAIGRDKLDELVSSCPEIAIGIMESMCGRLRRLNNALYRGNRSIQNKKFPNFKVPAEYSGSHDVREPAHDLNFIESVSAPCPICGKNIMVLNLKKKKLTLRKHRGDGRLIYKECEPMWYDVWTCPYCHYSNHYVSFFPMNPFKKELIKRVLTEKHEPVLKQHFDLLSPFDVLFLRYLGAIHINRSLDPSNHLLPGKLWLNLYWLFEDCGDEAMKLYAAKEASNYISAAIEKEEIQDEQSLHSMELSLAALYITLGEPEKARVLCDNVLKYDDNQLKKFAYEIRGDM